MGTEKRARQKELHRTRLEEARKEAARSERRTRLVGALVLVGIVGAVLAAVSFLGEDDTESASTSTTLPPQESTTSLYPPVTGAGPAAALTGETPCPPEDGSAARTTAFEGPPPTCIDPEKSYSATFTTTAGEFAVELDADAAPVTVNNFVVLARYHYYDGIPFHRIVPDFAIQAGDPEVTPTGVGGPGYTIAEEPPDSGTYAKYDLAMAKTQEPGSTGSQFFVVTGDGAGLEGGGYSLFGKVTAGQDVVDLINAIATTGPTNDTPTQQITIEAVAISET